MLDDVEADGFVDFGQRRKVEILAKQRDERQALVRLDRRQQVAHFGRVQAGDVLAQIDRVAVGNRGADMHQEVGTHRTVVGIDVRSVIDGDFFGTAVVVAGIAHERALETIANFPAAMRRSGKGTSLPILSPHPPQGHGP
ncbi:hypothetical protein D9M70_594310 [compost metagenome]